MKPKESAVLDMVIETGVIMGLKRATNHWEPGMDSDELTRISNSITEAVLSEMGEWFDFEEEHSNTVYFNPYTKGEKDENGNGA